MTSDVTLSSNLTLAQGVTYNIKLWLTSTIYAGSTLQIQFSTMYNINSSNLQNCQATISSSVALAAAACYPSNTASNYIVNFDTLFGTTSALSYINLNVRIC
jgi:hypothetical protein